MWKGKHICENGLSILFFQSLPRLMDLWLDSADVVVVGQAIIQVRDMIEWIDEILICFSVHFGV